MAMNVAIVYLAYRLFYRTMEFFRHWYIDSAKWIFHVFISTLERLDQIFAVKITLRHFFEPLYGDYTITGRILGVPLRSARIVVGSTLYFFVGALFLVAFIVWILIPITTIMYVFRNI